MKHYTVGFIFTSTLEKVLLIHKERPEWQKGKLNGPGGKIEAGETSLACIVREIQEETGLTTKEKDWRLFATFNTPVSTIDFYTLIYTGEEGNIQQITDEKLEWVNIKSMPENIISNLSWLVPMAKDKLVGEQFETAVVQYLTQ